MRWFHGNDIDIYYRKLGINDERRRKKHTIGRGNWFWLSDFIYKRQKQHWATPETVTSGFMILFRKLECFTSSRGQDVFMLFTRVVSQVFSQIKSFLINKKNIQITFPITPNKKKLTSITKVVNKSCDITRYS